MIKRGTKDRSSTFLCLMRGGRSKSVLKEVVQRRGRLRPFRTCKSGRLAVGVCVDLFSCPVLQGGVCWLSENIIFE